MTTILPLFNARTESLLPQSTNDTEDVTCDMAQDGAFLGDRSKSLFSNSPAPSISFTNQIHEHE